MDIVNFRSCLVEACQRCHEVDEERRTLWMACFYEMDELGIPFKHEISQTHIQDNGKKFYTLRVCKACRGSWMAAQINWFHSSDQEEELCGSGIFIREHGAIKEITEEEWYKRNPGHEPVRVKKEID
jgi:hypothetical protein